MPHEVYVDTHPPTPLRSPPRPETLRSAAEPQPPLPSLSHHYRATSERRVETHATSDRHPSSSRPPQRDAAGLEMEPSDAAGQARPISTPRPDSGDAAAENRSRSRSALGNPATSGMHPSPYYVHPVYGPHHPAVYGTPHHHHHHHHHNPSPYMAGFSSYQYAHPPPPQHHPMPPTAGNVSTGAVGEGRAVSPTVVRGHDLSTSTSHHHHHQSDAKPTATSLGTATAVGGGLVYDTDAVDVLVAARLEAKTQEIATLKRQNATLKTALTQTKDAFEQNVSQLTSCQEACRRLDETLLDRDQRVRELEQYRSDTQARVDHVEDLVRREKEHAHRIAEDLRRQLDSLGAERAALENRLQSTMEDLERTRHEHVILKRQHQRESHVSINTARQEQELEMEDRLRALRTKLDDKESQLRHAEGELASARNEAAREKDRAAAVQHKLEEMQSEVIQTQHRQQRSTLQKDELQQVREADVKALRREIEGLRAARDDATRAHDAQMLTITQDNAKKGHDLDLALQQLSAMKNESEATVRRLRSELDDAQRAADVKLRQVNEDLRHAQRQLQQTEDQNERLRRQLGEERSGRDFTDGERDALGDKIVALQRVIQKRDAEINRLNLQISHSTQNVEEARKASEAMELEMTLRSAREKKELSMQLEKRLDDFRSMSRMRAQATTLTEGGPADRSEVAALANRFEGVSRVAADAHAPPLPPDGFLHQHLNTSAGGLNASYTHTAAPNGGMPAGGGGGPLSPPRPADRSSGSAAPSPFRSLLPQAYAPPVTPISAANDASQAALSTVQRVLERQLAAERERGDDLQRRLEGSVSRTGRVPRRVSYTTDDTDNETGGRRSRGGSLNAAEAVVQRARRGHTDAEDDEGAGPEPTGLPPRGGAAPPTPTSRRDSTAARWHGGSADSSTMSRRGDQEEVSFRAPSPRAERLRQVSDALKRYNLGDDSRDSGAQA